MFICVAFLLSVNYCCVNIYAPKYSYICPSEVILPHCVFITFESTMRSV